MLLLLVLQELWTYQGFFLVAFKFYAFGLWFSYKYWIKVYYLYLWFAFQLLSLYLLFPVIILSCSVYVLYSLFLFCDVHQVKIMHQVPKKKKKHKKKRDFRKEIENRKKKKIYIYIYIVCSFRLSVLSDQNIVFFCPLPLIYCVYNIFLPSVLV